MRFSIDQDICMIPFSPITEEDICEIRFQCYNDEEEEKILTAAVFLDREEPDNLLFSTKETIRGYSFGFWSFRQCFTEGEHTLIFRVGDMIVTQNITVLQKRKPVLSGGFIMIGPPNDRTPCDPFRDCLKHFTEEDWDNYLTAMKIIGMDFIIVTVTVQLLEIQTGKPVAHYDSRYYPKSDIVANDPIGAILRAAVKNSQKIFMGLGHTYGGRLENTVQIMDELYDKYGKYPSFYGWYQSEETNFNYFNEKELSKWNEISDRRNQLSPVKPLLISPYFICKEDRLQSDVSEKLLKYLEENKVNFDIIMPQDMVGQSVLTVKKAGDIFRRLVVACQKNGVHLWANCEAFNFDENGHLLTRFKNGGFYGPEGYVAQIKSLYSYCEKVGTFMLSGFFTPSEFSPCPGGQLAIEQYEKYVNYLSGLS